MMKEEKIYPCPICNTTNQFYDEGGYEICNVCGWEDDGSQRKHLDEDGANHISMNEAKKIWLSGKCIYDSHPNIRADKH